MAGRQDLSKGTSLPRYEMELTIQDTSTIQHDNNMTIEVTIENVAQKRARTSTAQREPLVEPLHHDSKRSSSNSKRCESMSACMYLSI